MITMGQGIRVNWLGASFFEKTNGKSFYFGGGYEQNIGTAIAVSLEYNFGYSFGDGEESVQFQFPKDGDVYTVEYLPLMPWSEFSYSSKYFFSGNDDDSWYVSSGLAIRTVKYNLNLLSAYSNSSGNYATGLFPETVEEKSIVLTPITFKFGVRSSIDDWFQDYAIGFSYIPGGSSKKTGYTTIDTYAPGSFKNFAFTFSLAFGLGWAD